MKKVHEIVFNILKDNYEKGLLLDVAGGNGGFASKLKQSGYKAVYCDLYPPLKADAPCVQADMNHHMPFKSRQFQTVTCMESLQYFENHKLLFRELNRITKTDGRLIITMPNILNMSSRLFFLKTGYFKHFKPFRKNKDHREWGNAVYSPLSFVEIFQLLDCNGFKIETLAASKYSYRELPLFLIYKGLYKLMPVSNLDKKKNEMLDFLYAKEILLGDHIIVIAKKVV